MNYNEALSYIFSLKTVSLNPNLGRISAALELLSNPQDGLKVIHIAGTNGKGSVASMISEILKADGKKVGLFVSPFIIEFAERIQINGAYIPKAELVKLTQKMIFVQENLKEKGIELGQFEFITAIALMYFKEQACDYVVLETGLGGKYDPTNIFKKPLCTVITKISFDHTAILGNTIEQISSEKAGIIKSEVPCITCLQNQKALKVLIECCKSLSSPLSIVDPTAAQNVETCFSHTSFSYNGEDYNLSLLGVHQVENALLAIEAVKIVLPNISNEVIKMGLVSVSHPARLEVIKNNPTVIIDGAHNPNGALALAIFLKTVDFNGNIIFGGMRDKNIDEVAKALSPFAKKIITVTVENNPRSETATNLKETFSRYNDNVFAAVDYNQALALTCDSPTIICGSLYLAADMRKYFDKTI